MLRCGAGVIASLLSCAPAAAQWTLIRLHPEGFYRSEVLAVTPTTQLGQAHDADSRRHASSWRGSPGTWQSWAPLATISGVGGGQQAGSISVGPGSGHACVWNGSAQFIVDLHPAGAAGSSASAVAGGQQVGEIYPPAGGAHAALWLGSASSMIDLHPAGMSGSSCYATDGALQGGYVELSSHALNAAIWGGSAGSFINLHPAGANHSQVNGMAAGVQVGEANFGSGNHAILWRGTAASYVDLHPAGAGVSGLRATTGSVQGGWANMVQTGFTAAVWFGTAESFTPLPSPPGYFAPSATCVAELNGTIYVGGNAFSPETGTLQAFLWVGQAPGVCYANCDGSTAAPALHLSDFACFLQRYQAGDLYANCDGSTVQPVLNVGDFGCFLRRFAQGCP
ncbi:MAG: hypothetical protein WD749_05355 [Phycisphaerales bacterium]